MQRSALRGHWLAHWFGCGLIPVAPGTFGSLGAIPVHYLLSQLTALPHALALLALTAAGFVVCQRAAQASGDEDPQWVVIDEVIGTLIACWFVRGHGWLAVGLAFALFRLFDITKPGPIDRAQHLGPPGLSILLDDILAGLAAGALSFVAAWWI